MRRFSIVNSPFFSGEEPLNACAKESFENTLCLQLQCSTTHNVCVDTSHSQQLHITENHEMGETAEWPENIYALQNSKDAVSSSSHFLPLLTNISKSAVVENNALAICTASFLQLKLAR